MQLNGSSIASELNVQPFHRDILHHRSRTAWRSFTKWTTQWNDGHGWISWYRLWRNGGLRSPVAQRSPRTPSTYSACTSTWRKGGASWRYARCSVVPSSPWCLITVVFHCLLYLYLFFVNSIFFSFLRFAHRSVFVRDLRRLFDDLLWFCLSCVFAAWDATFVFAGNAFF